MFYANVVMCMLRCSLIAFVINHFPVGACDAERHSRCSVLVRRWLMFIIMVKKKKENSSLTTIFVHPSAAAVLK